MDQNPGIPVTPSALVNLFANAMPVKFTEQSYRLKGIYPAGKGVVYGGFYYDGLRDEVKDGNPGSNFYQNIKSCCP